MGAQELVSLRARYDTMRTPNLLGHRSPQEALQQSATWLPLLQRQCHPDARIFLCSLLAPVCLQRSVFAGATSPRPHL